jgi:5'-deoxynucleotidase YfbR-like HD superfamily hydrolase
MITLTNNGIYNYQDIIEGKSTYKYSLRQILSALSLNNRFNGNTGIRYTVLQHSILVSNLCINDPLIKIHGLIHDFHEAFTGDVTQPIQKFLGNEKLKHLQNAIDKDILKYFEIPELTTQQKRIVEKCDSLAFITEAHQLFGMKYIKEIQYVFDSIPEYLLFLKNKDLYDTYFDEAVSTSWLDAFQLLNKLFDKLEIQVNEEKE